MPLSRREQRMVIGGAGIATILLVYLLWPSAAPEQGAVELVPADQRQAPAPAAAPAPTAAPAVVPEAAAPVAPGAGTMPEGMVLTGITGRGAIFAFANGSQRYVAIGREVAPGLVLQAVRQHDVVIAAGPTTYRVGFGGPAVAFGGSEAPAAAAPGVAGNLTPAEAQRQAAQRSEAERYRAALAPRQVDGRIRGYVVRPGSGVAAFQRAGLRPGDVILSVNGTALGPEQLRELAWTLQNSTRTEFEIERGGQVMRLAIETNR